MTITPFTRGASSPLDHLAGKVARAARQTSLLAPRSSSLGAAQLPRLAFVLAGAFSPAHAETFVAWPGTQEPFTIQATPEAGPALWATIRVHNAYTSPATPDDAVLTMHGTTITVHVDHGPGDVPDRITVLPPAGIIAVPASLDLPEMQDGTIRLFVVAEGLVG